MTSAIRRGVQGGYLNLAVTWLAQLVMVPLLLHHLGATGYGLYAALTSVVGYFGLLTFGSALTVPRYVAEHAARGDREALGDFASSYLAAHLAVAVIGTAAALAAAPLVPRLLAAPPELRAAIAPAFRLVVAGWALGVTAGLHQSLLVGLADVQLANLSNSARTLLNLGAAAMAVSLGTGLLGLLVALSLASLAGSAGAWLLVRHRHPDIPIALRRARLATLRDTGRSAGLYFLMQVSALVVMGTDTIVIGAFVGVQAVAPYAVVFQLWAMALAVLWAGADVLMPFFTRWQAEGDRETLSRTYLLATRTVFAGSVLAAIVVGFFGPALIRIWVGPALAIDARLPWIFAAMFLTATPIHMAAMLLAALGRHRNPALGGAAEAALNLTLSLLLVGPLGVVGVAIGTLLSGALTNAWVAPGTACRVLGIAPAAYLRRALLPALVPASAAAVAAIWVAGRTAGGSVAELFGVGGIAALFGLLFWWLGLDADERRTALSLAGRS